MSTHRECNIVQIVKGGAEYALNRTETILIQRLMAASPNFIPVEELKSGLTNCHSYFKQSILNLRALCTMNDCIIECERGRGYRLMRIRKYDFSISN